MKIRKMRHLWSTRLHNYPRGHQRQHHQPCKVSLNTPFTHGKCCLLAATALVENPVNQPCSVTSGSAASTAFVLPAFQNLIPLQPLRVQLEILHNQQEPAQSSGWAEDRMCLPGEQQHAWSCPATPCQGAGLQSQGKGVAKRVQNVAGRYSHSYHCYIPSSHITSIPKNECWFAKPRNWAGLSLFGAGRAHKSYPSDFILLAQTDKATDCCGHPSVPWHTQRQQHPHGDLTAPPSFPAGTQQLENGHGLQKTHEWYRRLLSLCWFPVPAFPDLLMWFLTTFWGGKNTHNKFFPGLQYERD